MTDKHRDTERQKERERQRETVRLKERKRQRERQRDRDRENEWHEKKEQQVSLVSRGQTVKDRYRSYRCQNKRNQGLWPNCVNFWRLTKHVQLTTSC